MWCSEVKKELYLYITDEIDAVKKPEVERHLELCSGCSMLHDNFVKLLGDINKTIIEYPRKNWDFFAEQILDGIYEREKFIFWKPALAFALSFFVFIAGYIYYHSAKADLRQKKFQENVVLSDTEALVAYLSNFDTPELYQ
ncbi:MAG: zf-HC2 domain-containing protein [Elusimicrobiota bacterium]